MFDQLSTLIYRPFIAYFLSLISVHTFRALIFGLNFVLLQKLIMLSPRSKILDVPYIKYRGTYTGVHLDMS